MVARFPTSVRWRVVYLSIHERLGATEIANRLYVSTTFVKKILRIYQTTTGVDYPRQRSGKKRKLNGQYSCVISVDFSTICSVNIPLIFWPFLYLANELLLLKVLIQRYPEMYEDEMSEWIQHVAGKIIDRFLALDTSMIQFYFGFIDCD